MVKKILGLFLIWRSSLFVISVIASFLISFGWRFPYYDMELLSTHLPVWLIGFGNFDGVHFLRIAHSSYSSQYSQAFFPLFPIIIKLFTINNAYFLSGLLLSNIFFLGALLFLYKLFRLDFDQRISFRSIIFLLIFPTSFYFGSIYSETLFLLLTVSSLFFMRKKNFFISGLFAGLASATRVTGIILFPVLLVEIFLHFKKGLFKPAEFLKTILGMILAPMGMIVYMIYLKIAFNNPLYFLTAQPAFGNERSAQPFILLPQVFYRYCKILSTVPITSQAYFNASLELIFTLFLIMALVLTYKKIRFSYSIFTLGCLILPTLTGTLTSMPRYVLMGFLTVPSLVTLLGSKYKLIIIPFVVLGIILFSLFIRGHWVA